jgi:copper transport protein
VTETTKMNRARGNAVAAGVGKIADMATRPRRWRTVSAGLVAVLIGILAGSFALAAPASAHASLVSSDPPANTIVAQAPTQVTLTFTESVGLVNGKVTVTAPDNTRADQGQPRVNGDQVIIPLRPNGKRGTYLVSYRIVSADSHPVGGAFTYSVIVTSTPPTSTSGSVATSPVISAVFPIARWLGYAGLVLLVGAVLVLATLWPQRLSPTGPIRVIWLGAGLVALSTLLELGLQIPNEAGGFGDVTKSDVQDVLSSQFGAAHLIRLGVLVAAMFLLRPIVRGKGWGADRVLLAVLGAIGIATWSVSGHPYASPIPTVTVVADMIHIAAMSVWLGGLVMLAVFLLPKANAAELSAIVPVWSRWAAYAVGALILTGIAQGLVEVGSVSALFTTGYGQLLIAKVVLLGAVLLVASYSRRMVGPIMEKAKGAAGRLRRLVATESVGALAIIAVASVLVQVTPARAPAADTAASTIQSAVLPDPGGLLTLTVDESPAKVGANELHMFANKPDGTPINVEEWTVTASLPSAGIEPITVLVLNLGPGHAQGEVSLPKEGSWTFNFTIRTSKFDDAVLSTNFSVTG